MPRDLPEGSFTKCEGAAKDAEACQALEKKVEKSVVFKGLRRGALEAAPEARETKIFSN